MSQWKHYREDEFDLMLGRLNALSQGDATQSPRWAGWREVVARKEHTDKFGITIQADEVYYKRDLGGSWGNVLKLSRASMDRLLFVLFGSNHDLQELADELGRQS